jgi:hypothetical protein
VDISGKVLDPNTEKGSAQLTLEMVYGREVVRAPGLTLEKLLSSRSEITERLGSVVHLKERSAKALCARLSEYVDSKNASGALQCWPVVRMCAVRHNWQVRIF